MLKGRSRIVSAKWISSLHTKAGNYCQSKSIIERETQEDMKQAEHWFLITIKHKGGIVKKYLYDFLKSEMR